MRTFEALLATGKPRCGQVRDTQRDFLFGPEAASIGSVALVPLGDTGSLGLLALGSAERERFHPGHEHGIPQAHGRAHHGRPVAAVKATDGRRPSSFKKGAPISDVARERLAMLDRRWIDGYLTHLSKERRLSPHTSSNYARDLARSRTTPIAAMSPTGNASTASTCACSRRAPTPAA